MTNLEKLKMLRAIVDEQAEDEMLWVIEMPGQPAIRSIFEAHLQQELRRLHAAIEEFTDG